MNSRLKNIYEAISSYIEINDEEWTAYSSMFRIKEFKKKEIILNAGTICRDVFFVDSGLLRIYFVDKEGNEKTFHFTQENNFATDYESLLNRTISNYSIQAIEDSTVILMSYEMLHTGYKSLRFGEKLGRLLAEDYFFMMSDKIKSIYTQTPIERYQNMNIKFPKILQRVPQHYIASYLNISSVHLSRLKNS
jgi:CRP-like cAMP-binding protein